MRLGVVTTSYPRFPGDAAGNFVAGHVEALRALGHAVEVIAAGPPTGERDIVRIPDSLFYTGGAPDRLEAAPLAGAVAGAAFTARLAAAVAGHAPRWDSIVAHWLVPSALAALPTRVPLLAIAHGGDVHTLRRTRLLAPALHALRLRGARLVFVSAELRDVAIASVRSPVLARWLAGALVQPMGVALERFAAIARAPSDPPVIAIASRLVPVKGIDVAIAAMAHVRTPARLVIAGDGPARAALAAAAGPRVTFLGELAADARDRLLAEASVVIVPSRVTPGGRTEGTPLIAVEALAAGVPVVASSLGGLRELPALTLVPPEDPRALAAAIDRVLAAPPASATLRQAVAHLDWMRVTRRLLDYPDSRTSRRTA